MWILCCAQTHFLSPRLYKNLVSQLEIWICLIVPFHPVLWSWKFCMGVPVCFVCVHEYITGIWKWGEIEEVSRTWIIEMWYTVYDSLWRNVMYYCRFCVSRVGLKYQKTICIWHISGCGNEVPRNLRTGRFCKVYWNGILTFQVGSRWIVIKMNYQIIKWGNHGFIASIYCSRVLCSLPLYKNVIRASSESVRRGPKCNK